MIRSTLLSLALVSLTASPALAAPCKDAKGRFIKCPTSKAAPVRCKDAHGKFTKCGTKGATPMK